MASVQDGPSVSTEVPADVAATLRALVRSLQDAFNAHDPVALSAHFAEEAAWSNVLGAFIGGRPKVEESGRGVLPQLREQYARYDVVRLLALRPDVIAVNVLQTPTTAAGAAVDGHRAAALYVFAKEPGGWKIAAGQNTVIGGPPA